MNPFSQVVCSKCGGQLSAQYWNTTDLAACPSCKTWLQVFVFPAFLKRDEHSHAGEQISSEEEASCFYHPQKKATSTCDGCGVFLCGLCDIPFGQEHLCPRCLERGKEKGKLKQLENRRVLYDDIALALAVFPVLIFYMTLFTAPATLFLAIRHWKTPSSITRHSKFRMILAIIFSTLQIIGWITLFVYLARR